MVDCEHSKGRMQGIWKVESDGRGVKNWWDPTVQEDKVTTGVLFSGDSLALGLRAGEHQ